MIDSTERQEERSELAARTLAHQRGALYAFFGTSLLHAPGGVLCGLSLATEPKLVFAGVGVAMVAAGTAACAGGIIVSNSNRITEDDFNVPGALKPKYPTTLDELVVAEKLSHLSFRESLVAPIFLAASYSVLPVGAYLQVSPQVSIAAAVGFLTAAGVTMYRTWSHFLGSAQYFGNWEDRTYNFLVDNRLGRYIRDRNKSSD